MTIFNEAVVFTNLLALIVLFPLVGAAINGLLGRALPKSAVSFFAVGSVAASFVLAAVLFASNHLRSETGVALSHKVYEWITIGGSMKVDFAFLMDELSGIMTLVVTFVGLLIHIYSIGYMARDPAYHRYFAYLNLFTFSMLMLVLGDNLVVMFIGWEGVGLCSYLLIGFWFADEEKAKAGLKAFVANRIGDAGFLIALFILFYFAGSLSYRDLYIYFKDGVPAAMGPAMATLAGLCLFLGATGKSAQFPLYVWLPDAMAGPTPVSALIHAATMVTAGVYMIARLNFFYVHVPNALAVVALVGTFTALFAATIGLFQTDIKKVLAYSTVSQLGFMFMGVGVGAWAAGVFHLFTHAFFKALLFLGSGSVIHAMSGEQDIRKMGGLAKKLPLTYWTFAIGTFTIAGFPPAAAFFSKDEILWRAFAAHNEAIWFLPYLMVPAGLLAAFCTSFYMYRMFYLAFSGECRADAKTISHIHESPKVMTYVLAVLAGFSLVAGFLGMPRFLGGNLFEEFLFRGPVTARVEAHGPVGLEIGLIAFSVLVAVAGWLAARYFYGVGDRSVADAYKARFARLYAVVQNKYYVDEIYFYALLRPIKHFAHFLWSFIDGVIIDGLIVGGASCGAAFASRVIRLAHNGNAHVYLAAFVFAAAVLMWLLF